MRADLPNKFLAESKNYTFDFSSLLAVGETISTQSCGASTYSGTDATPSAILSGAASRSGAIIMQLIIAGTVGVIYELSCTAVTSLGQTLTITGYLAVIPDLV